VWRSLALAKHDGHDNSYQHRQADDCNNVHRNSLSPLYAVRETRCRRVRKWLIRWALEAALSLFGMRDTAEEEGGNDLPPSVKCD
jgi:hypothetical protein